MFVRVVRFTDVTPEQLTRTLRRIRASGGPPPGVPSTGLEVFYDEAQGTVVVVQYFATAEDMETAAPVMATMHPADTPGVRASVDMCEIMHEVAV